MIEVKRKSIELKERIEINYNYGCSNILKEGEQSEPHTKEITVTYTVTSSTQLRAERLLKPGYYLLIAVGYGYKITAYKSRSGKMHYEINGIREYEWKSHRKKELWDVD